MNKENKISVIITTKNEERNIGRCLRALQKQKYKNFEIIVVDNNSTDDTQKISGKYTKNVYNKGPERSSQRNFGAQKSHGKYLLFIDADMELSSNVLSECISLVTSKENVGGITIPEVAIGKNYFEKVKAFERSIYNESGDQFTDAARFFPKSVFEKVGGYDETITGPEDWDLPDSIRKEGYQILRIAATINHYEYIPSLFALLRKKYYYAKRAHRYLRKQNIQVVSPKTVYFLRPVFYKHWRKYFSHPLLFLGMVILLSGELISGGIGFIEGKVRNI